MGVSLTYSSRWWSACCATYDRRNAWCFHVCPMPSSGSKSPIRSFKKVDFPEPLPPTITARDPSVSVAFALSRMNLSVSGYLNEMSFIVRMGLRNVRMPSGLPGSGNRMGSMRPAAIISSTLSMVDFIADCSESSVLIDILSKLSARDPVREMPFEDPASLIAATSDTSEGVLFSAMTAAADATPLSTRGSPAAISGLSVWKAWKVIG
mmetsp:Transcript_35327/g.58518  ORF Transcript_35327/g.58518 Transcript_35327/m.58518 type:complete len:208 (-) Transcript_35327:37-660(-)